MHPALLLEGWCWQDNDGSWRRYEMTTSCVSSDTIEKCFVSSSTGIVHFNKDQLLYVIDFSTMKQVNTTTKSQRPVKRIKFNYRWFCETDGGTWSPYDPISDTTIEAQFVQNASSIVQIVCNGNQYEIDLANMLQVNSSTRKSRRILRVPSGATLSEHSRPQRECVWQWKNDDGTWSDFDETSGMTSSGAIQAAFDKNPHGCFRFHCNSSLYEIDLRRKMQANKSTGKTRDIRCRTLTASESSNAWLPAIKRNLTKTVVFAVRVVIVAVISTLVKRWLA